MLEIDSWEDRSGDPTPSPNSFGYVNFNDGSRVGYSPNAEGHAPVWQPRTNGGGEYREVTEKHFQMAFNLLREKGIITDAVIEKMRQSEKKS